MSDSEGCQRQRSNSSGQRWRRGKGQRARTQRPPTRSDCRTTASPRIAIPRCVVPATDSSWLHCGRECGRSDGGWRCCGTAAAGQRAAQRLIGVSVSDVRRRCCSSSRRGHRHRHSDSDPIRALHAPDGSRVIRRECSQRKGQGTELQKKLDRFRNKNENRLNRIESDQNKKPKGRKERAIQKNSEPYALPAIKQRLARCAAEARCPFWRSTGSTLLNEDDGEAMRWIEHSS